MNLLRRIDLNLIEPLSRKLLRVAHLASAGLWLTFSTPLQAVGIMVNEYKNAADNGTITNKMAADEFIEFVLTENATASALASLTFGSTNAATSLLQGVFAFDLATLNTALASAGLSEFRAGTIIAVKGANLGAQNLTYNPTSAGASNHDAWSLELVAGSGALDRSETIVDGNLSVDNQGGVIWVSSSVPASKTDTSGFLHAFGHDNAPGAIANAVTSLFGAGNILSSTIGAPKSVYNSASTSVTLATDNNSTMAAPNPGANTTWIVDNLRQLVPEPSRALFLLAGLASIVMKRRRSK